jgi:hypothetical protein
MRRDWYAFCIGPNRLPELRNGMAAEMRPGMISLFAALLKAVVVRLQARGTLSGGCSEMDTLGRMHGWRLGVRIFDGSREAKP